MKKWLVLGWLMIPVGLLTYHYGPGQKHLAWNEARQRLDEAHRFEAEAHWDEAIAAHDEVLRRLPESAEREAIADRIRLAQLRARFELGQLPEALADVQILAEAVHDKYGPDDPITQEARDLLGRVHYQAMIVLRLESAEEEVWKRHWERSRQNFRYLAESSRGERNRRDRQNLEAVIKSATLPVPLLPAAQSSAAATNAAAAGSLQQALQQALLSPPPPATTDGPVPRDARRLEVPPQESDHLGS